MNLWFTLYIQPYLTLLREHWLMNNATHGQRPRRQRNIVSFIINLFVSITVPSIESSESIRTELVDSALVAGNHWHLFQSQNVQMHSNRYEFWSTGDLSELFQVFAMVMNQLGSFYDWPLKRFESIQMKSLKNYKKKKRTRPESIVEMTFLGSIKALIRWGKIQSDFTGRNQTEE